MIITNEQGLIIREFIEKHKDKRFMIHCAAGVSRSAGVGCAVECIVNFEGSAYYYQTGSSDIKAHSRYSPNYTVFRAIVDSVGSVDSVDSATTNTCEGFNLCRKCGSVNKSTTYCAKCSK